MTLASRFLSLALIGGTLALSLPAQAADIVDNWAQVQAPAAPKLENVTVDPKTTALLMLDFLKQNCGPNPACTAALPGVKSLLDQARAKKMYVVYSKFPGPRRCRCLAASRADRERADDHCLARQVPEDEFGPAAQEKPHQDRDRRRQRLEWRGSLHRTDRLLLWAIRSSCRWTAQRRAFLMPINRRSTLLPPRLSWAAK